MEQYHIIFFFTQNRLITYIENEKNIARIMKKKALWARVLLKKYCSNARMISSNPDGLPSSPNWKAVKAGFPAFSKGIWWRVRNNSRKNVWMERWIRGQALRELIEGPLTREDV